MLKSTFSVCISLAVIVVGLGGVLHGQELEAIAEKCDSLCQVSDAPWRTIPWEIDLVDAQKMAVEQSKPIFIWAMDGHPLGCT